MSLSPVSSPVLSPATLPIVVPDNNTSPMPTLNLGQDAQGSGNSSAEEESAPLIPNNQQPAAPSTTKKTISSSPEKNSAGFSLLALTDQLVDIFPFVSFLTNELHLYLELPMLEGATDEQIKEWYLSHYWKYLKFQKGVEGCKWARVPGYGIVSTLGSVASSVGSLGSYVLSSVMGSNSSKEAVRSERAGTPTKQNESDEERAKRLQGIESLDNPQAKVFLEETEEDKRRRKEIDSEQFNSFLKAEWQIAQLTNNENRVIKFELTPDEVALLNGSLPPEEELKESPPPEVDIYTEKNQAFITTTLASAKAMIEAAKKHEKDKEGTYGALKCFKAALETYLTLNHEEFSAEIQAVREDISRVAKKYHQEGVALYHVAVQLTEASNEATLDLLRQAAGKIQPEFDQGLFGEKIQQKIAEFEQALSNIGKAVEVIQAKETQFVDTAEKINNLSAAPIVLPPSKSFLGGLIGDLESLKRKVSEVLQRKKPEADKPLPPLEEL